MGAETKVRDLIPADGARRFLKLLGAPARGPAVRSTGEEYVNVVSPDVVQLVLARRSEAAPATDQAQQTVAPHISPKPDLGSAVPREAA